MRWPRPCRARNATRFPSNVPSTMASEGSPNGVFTRTSRVFVNPFIAYSPLPPMMPIAAWTLDFALFDLLAFSAAISLLSSSREGRSSSGFRSRRKTDPSFDRRLPRPIPQAAIRRPLLPKRVRATEIRGVRSDDFSNARRVFAGAARSIQNVSGISQPSLPLPQFPCSPKPPCAPPEDASRRVALPATAWPAIVAPDGLRLRDPLCSRQICRQSPSARLSYFECRRQALAPAPRAHNPPAARCQFHPGQLQPSRSVHVSSLLHPEAARFSSSRAGARREILASPSSG